MGRTQVKSGPQGPRKSVILGALGLVAIGVVFRMVSSTPAPPAAGAAPALAVATATAAPTVRPLPPLRIDWPLTLHRDLFDQSLVLPPPTTVPTTRHAAEVPTPPPSTRPAGPDPREQAIADARRNLRLSSTMLGPEPVALVNGQMYRVNDVVAGFRIVAIEDRRMIVERQGVRLAIVNE
jgi:hypothetical protein